MPLPKVAVMWFRRDLRLADNAALYHALRSGYPVVPLFVFDKHILDKLDDTTDARVTFIHQAIESMQATLVAMGSSMQVYHTTPEAAWEQLASKFNIVAAYTNTDYEHYAVQRDAAIAQWLQNKGAVLHSFKDQVIFEKNEVVKDDGKPYTVFTPYSKKWKLKLTPYQFKAYPTEKYFDAFYKQSPQEIPALRQMGFAPTTLSFPPPSVANDVLQRYKEQRDYPAIKGTSLLGVHLRFGTISIRALARQAAPLSEGFLNELIWRDFYHQITHHFPHIGEGKAFRKEYDAIQWRNNEAEFEAWCQGKTGYPIVDAGMRELNTTGYMHNRVRMIVASFLTKHLLIDWRWGEAYFAKKLLDFDFAANNGGWQWAAGSGCDAAPYFRVFNPTLQAQKFDKDGRYIRKWVPELNSFSYPKPIVQHEVARKRVLEAYAVALKK
jgi:deoxyribodipyrimidine photo-lyase